MKPEKISLKQRQGAAYGFWLRVLVGVGVLGVMITCAGLYMLDSIGITPRSLGPYIERRSDGHNAIIETIGEKARQWLLYVDRGDLLPVHVEQADHLGSIGAQHGRVRLPGNAAFGADVLVSDTAGLARAMASATPGQTIILLPGRYRVERPLEAARPGSVNAPIVVRAQEPGKAQLEIATGEGIRVSAPFWEFRDLSLRGVCSGSSYCEHAFHVVGKAQHFIAFNNLIEDFDAHIKINGHRGAFPDHGLIASNTLRNTSIRQTTKPVTPIDLVAASHWTVRHNLISDFIKGGGDRISYGVFAKGGGSHNVFEQNIVLCEDRFRGTPGQRIGMSLGGGGTGKPYCRDRRCITEQDDSVLQSNLVASCSDDGIYLNAAARSKIVHNTLVDTGGITVRFPESSANIDGNLVDGIIRSRDGGLLRLTDNLSTSAARLYVGSHPYRVLFRGPAARDFRWDEPVSYRASSAPSIPDLCGGTRPRAPRYGAFEDFAACLAVP